MNLLNHASSIEIRDHFGAWVLDPKKPGVSIWLDTIADQLEISGHDVQALREMSTELQSRAGEAPARAKIRESFGFAAYVLYCGMLAKLPSSVPIEKLPANHHTLENLIVSLVKLSDLSPDEFSSMILNDPPAFEEVSLPEYAEWVERRLASEYMPDSGLVKPEDFESRRREVRCKNHA